MQLTMRPIVKYPLILLIGFLGLYTALFLLAWGEYHVPQTAADDPSIPTISVNGATFHVETAGNPDNPVVIGVHGGPGMDHQNIRSLLQLADEYFVVLYDQRGTGLSPRVPKDELTLPTYLDDIDALIDHYGRGEPVAIVGHSFGGTITAWYIGQHPDKVHHVVLAEPAFLDIDLMEDMASRMSILNMSMFYSLAEGWFQSLHVNGPDDRAEEDHVLAHVASAGDPGYFIDGKVDASLMPMKRASFDAWAGMQESLLNTVDELGYTKDLDQYKRTVLFLASPGNIINGLDFQEKQLRFFPKAELVEIPDCGHFLFTEQPDATIEAIRDFLHSDTQ
jgi:proline iminopeptidase